METQVRAAALTNYIAVARSVGLDPYEMMNRAGISPALLAEPDNRLPGRAVADLLEDSARQSGHQNFGLLMAESRSIETVGAIILLLKHQGSAREVIDEIVHYQALISEALVIGMREVDGACIIHIDLVPSIAGRQSIELTVGLSHMIMKAILHERWQPEAVHFVHEAPDELAVHRRFLERPLVFRSEFNGFSCASASLDDTDNTAEPILAQHAKRYLDTLLPDSQFESAIDRVRRSLYMLIPLGRADLEAVSDNLGLHRRALQRLIEDEGETFAALLTSVRRELATRYLSGSEHSITSIAHLTGYATSSSFTRWFSGEFGTTPASWRAAELKAGQSDAASFKPPRTRKT